MDASLEEAAENLGTSGWRRFREITFPLILPTILSAALMVFMTSLADFGTPALIGEGFRVLPVSIYDAYMSELGAGNTAFANVLSVVVVVFALLVLLLQKKALAGRDYMMSGLRPMKRKTLSGVRSVLVALGSYFVAFLAVLPQLTVAVTSFVKTSGPVFLPGFGFESYAEAFGKMSDAILNSFLFSLSAIAIMVFSALLISYLIVREQSRASTLIDMMVMFPYVIPGAVLGIMLSSTFNGMPLPLTGTAFILILSYVIRKLPFTLRGFDRPWRDAGENILSGDGAADAARRHVGRDFELDCDNERVELVSDPLYGRNADHFCGDLQRGYEQSAFWHGGGACDDLDGGDGSFSCCLSQTCGWENRTLNL